MDPFIQKVYDAPINGTYKHTKKMGAGGFGVVYQVSGRACKTVQSSNERGRPRACAVEAQTIHFTFPPLNYVHYRSMYSTTSGSPVPAGRVEGWTPHGFDKIVGFSAQHWVARSVDRCTLLKHPPYKTLENMSHLRSEAERCQIIGPHPSLVSYKGWNEDGLLLEFCEQGPLSDVIGSQALTQEQLFAISKQIAHGVIYLHKQNHVRCDLNTRNVFVTSGLNAKIGNMQGQLYHSDGSIIMPAMSHENAKARHPFAGEDEFSVRTDIFALGTHGHPTSPELDECRGEDVVQERYRKGELPIDLLSAIGMDDIIGKCWTSVFHDANEVLAAMDALDIT